MKLPAASGRGITRIYHLYPLTLTLNAVELRGRFDKNPPKSPFDKGGLLKAPPFPKGGDFGGIKNRIVANKFDGNS